MKIFTKYLLISLLLLSLFNSSLQGQTIKVVTPSNAAASAAEIKATFGNLINVSVGQIENFYLSTWIDEPFESLCNHPFAEVVQMNNSSVQFEWTLSSGGIMPTAIHSLRLSNGLIQSSNSSTGSAAMNIPNDLYLFIFQTECSDGRSAADIVIIDKPVMLNGFPCDCKEFKDVWDEPFPATGGNAFTDYLWPYEDEGDYHCKVVFDEGTTSTLRFHINYTNGIPSSIGTYQNCLENVVAQWNGTFLGAVNYQEFSVLGTFLFATNNSFTFQPMGGSTGHIYLKRCKHKSKPRLDENQISLSEDDILFTSINNPFIDHTTIQYNLPTNQNISIQLYNAFGQAIKQLKAPALTKKGIYKMDLDLSNLPGGMYFCILKTNKQNISLKLQKTN